MRKYTIPQNMTVEYVLSDHLNSTSLTTDANGAKVLELRYKAWGEVRATWTANPTTTPAYKSPAYTYTGQYSYMDDPTTSGVEGFGLMFYNARWYDPAIGMFAQVDTMIPQTQGTQAWGRYAYSNNNPVKYTEPSGHFAAAAALTLGFGFSFSQAFATLAAATIAVVTSPAFITAVVVIAIVAVVTVAAVVAYDLITDDQVVGMQIEGEGTPDNPNPCLFCGLSKYPLWVAGGVAAGYGAAVVCDGIASVANADSCVDAFSNNDQKPDTMPTSTPSSDSNSATTPAPTSTPSPSTSEPPLPTPNLSCRLTLTCSISTPGTLETR